MRLVLPVIVGLLVTCCNSNKKNQNSQPSPYLGIELNIPGYINNKISNGERELLVYYFDGSCPICYSKVVNIKEDKSIGKDQLLIWHSNDTAVANFNLKQLKINEFVIYDEYDSFRILNPEIPVNTALIIDGNNRVIEEYYP